MTTPRNPVTRYAGDPARFRRDLLLQTARGVVSYGDALADFQRRDFAAIDSAFVALAASRMPECGRFWIERTKGSSKDTDLSSSLLWLLLVSPRPLVCQVGAADEDQADELRLAAKGFVQANRWLEKFLIVQAGAIINPHTEARCDIIAADVAGSHGARPDLLILNELSHVGKREFAENLLDNATKVPGGIVVIATNAGFVPSWQWDWRENARTAAVTTGRWYFSAFQEPAPWIPAEEIAEAKRRNPPSRFARLWGGQWVSGAGDALDRDDVTACVVATDPMLGTEPGWLYALGADLGVTRDASSIVIVARSVSSYTENPGWHPLMHESRAPSRWIKTECTGRYRLASVQLWKAVPGQRVDLQDVENAILEAHRTYGLSSIGLDPWQAELMARRLAGAGLPVELTPFTPQNLRDMASAVLETFSGRLIDLFPHDQLLADLRALRLTEKSYGVRLESPRGPSGHGDAATGLALALLGARRLPTYLDPPTRDDEPVDVSLIRIA